MAKRVSSKGKGKPKTKTKRTTKKKVQKPKVDNRIPKILGIGLILFSIFLFLAFCSYLFTWQYDFDKVEQKGWALLSYSSLEIRNMLGRVGAILAHHCFAWFVGIGAFMLVPFTFYLGRNLLLEKPLSQLNKLFQYGFVGMFLISVFAAFVFDNSQFPWGGTIGNYVNTLLRTHLGVIGTMIVFLLTLFILFIIIFNPNFSEWGDKYKFMSWLTNPKKAQRNSEMGSVTSEEANVTDGIESTAPPMQVDNTAVQQQTIETNIPQPAPTKEDISKAPEINFNFSTNEEPTNVPSFNIEVPTSKPTESNTPPPPKEEKKDFEIDLDAGKKNELADVELRMQEDNKEKLEPYDPTKDLSKYTYPSTSLLYPPSTEEVKVSAEELRNLGLRIEQTLLDHKIQAKVVRATVGPTVTLFELKPAPGVPLSKIKRLGPDLAMSLKAPAESIPIAPIPGNGTVGLEVPNHQRQTVSLRELLESDGFKNSNKDLPLALGKTIDNKVFIADLAKMPHLLVAGATGQGKSVGINTILMSILYKKHPSEVKLVLVDPKKVELSIYDTIKNHFLAYLDENEPIITETERVVNTVASLCKEMDDRYKLLESAKVRNLKEYNKKFISRKLNPQKGHRFLPYIVLIIDEFADLIMTAGKEVEMPIARLAQLARAIGIHLIVATQRPTANIITGTIKANFPARMSFKVSSGIDSKTIMDRPGAEDLLGKGDMLISVDGKVVRIQGAFVDTPEVDSVIDFIAEQQGFPLPCLLPELEEAGGSTSGTASLKDMDEYVKDAAYTVVMNQSGSTSMLQRKFKLGYNRAGRIMDELELLRVVGPSKAGKPREVYFDSTDELEQFLSQFE